jgi:tetratricopeptide (TPR) repeat protein
MIDRHYNFNYSSGAGENGYLIKIYNLSIRYYNRGIVLAKEGKYTEAVHSLRKSVALKKDNIQAQNLLGLVYYKLGRVTDGILHWQISLKYQKSGNDALKYIQDCSYSVKEMSKIDAVTAYNKALHSIKLDNVDLAVMSLKKALELNSSFVDANILMALCRMKQGNISAAIRLLEKVLRIDKENEKAVAYLKELKPDTTSVFKKKNKENTEKKGVTIIRNLMNHSYSMLSFGVGALCAVVILGGLIMPAISGGYRKNLEEQELQYNIDLNNKNDQLSKNNETIKRLTDENENLKSKLYTAGEQELQQRVRALADIEMYYNEGSVGEAADKLLALSTSGFGQEAINQYNQLKTTILPAGAKYYYELGASSQSKNDMDNAKVYFDKCIKCTGDGDEIRYSAMYQLAKIAEKAGDNNTAAKYFTTVANKHPVEAIRNEAKKFVEQYRES